MNFDSFLKLYGIDESIHSIVIERETLIDMLTNLYSDAYDDGAYGEKLIRLETQ